MKQVVVALLFFGIGVLAGGYIFRDVQPRSFLALDQCKESCASRAELLGLAGAVGVLRADNLLPNVIIETDTTLAIAHPFPEAKQHYVIIPKHDIKHAGDFTQDEARYLVDVYAVIGRLIREKQMDKYRIITNGPGYQQVNYIHFHLLSRDE